MKEAQKYEDLFFTDNFMFCKIMENDERIDYANRQECIAVDFGARGIWLDVVVKGDGKIFLNFQQ